MRRLADGYVGGTRHAVVSSRWEEELVIVVIFGIILLAAASVFTAAVVTSNTRGVSGDLWGASVSDVSLGTVFLVGMVTAAAALLGLALLLSGLRHTARLRGERRQLRRENERLNQQVTSTSADEETVRSEPARPVAAEAQSTDLPSSPSTRSTPVADTRGEQPLVSNAPEYTAGASRPEDPPRR